MLETATLTHTLGSAGGRARACCDVCHEVTADCSPVVHRGARVSTCRKCIVRHVIGKQDRARFDLAVEARRRRDGAAGGDWRQQLAGLKRQTEAARHYRPAVRR